MSEKWIYWLKELGTNDNNIVGKKCANLGELTQAGFNVPPGYALSVEAYKRFMTRDGGYGPSVGVPEEFQCRP